MGRYTSKNRWRSCSWKRLMFHLKPSWDGLIWFGCSDLQEMQKRVAEMEEEVDTETVAMLSHMGFSIKNSSKISRIRPGSSGSGSSSFSHGQMTRRVRVPTGIPMLLWRYGKYCHHIFFLQKLRITDFVNDICHTEPYSRPFCCLISVDPWLFGCLE